jgi:glycosyltransferase involved in cell wall biosynthesis
MKVIIASFLFETNIGGGAAVVVSQLAQSLIRTNYEVVVLTTWSGSHVKTENVDGVKVIRLPASNLYWIADKDRQPVYKKIFWQLIDVWNPLIYRMTRDIFLNEMPDIVHSHKLRGLSPSIWSAASSAGVKKIIHTCHDFELISPEGLLMGRVGRLAKEQSLIMRPYQSIRRHFSRLVQHVTAPSRFVSELHTKMGFFPMAKSWVMPNTHGLDSGKLKNVHLKSQALSERIKCTQFLYIGRLDKAKGIDLLCQVFSQVAGEDHNLLLKVAGWGPLDEFLREKYKHQNCIQFTGPVFGDEKAELLGSSDVVIAPSLAPESFGIVIAEAYAYGLPVIASRIGAYPEIVKNGKTGFLVEPGSAEELYSTILSIRTKKSQLKTMSENCFAEAQNFAVEKFLSDYLDVYEGGT